MADEINEYVDYLVSQGESKEDAKAYGDYLRGKSARPSNLEVIKKMASGVETAFEYLDRYTGAPARTAVSGLQNLTKNVLEESRKQPSKSKPEITGQKLLDIVSSSWKQVGKPSSLAPTPKQLAERADVPSTALSDVAPSLFSETGEGLPLKKGGLLDVTASGAASIPIGMAADITNLALPVGRLAKLGKPLFAKTAEAFTGVPARETMTYINNLPNITKLGRKYGDDIASASDEIRRQYQADIAAARQKQNALITAAKESSSTKPSIGIAPITDALESYKATLNPKTKASSIKEIEDIVDNVKNMSEAGKVNVSDLYDIKADYLNQLASGAYKKDGQIFQVGSDAAKAAKSASFEARNLIKQAAPEISQADKTLSTIRNVEKRINKNLISEGRSEGALLAQSPRTRKQLELLGEITDSPMIQKADELAAFRRFSKPEYLPIDVTGKSGARLAASQALATVGSTLLGGGANPWWNLAALTATSPAALKTVINLGATGGKVAGYALPVYSGLSTPSKSGYYGLLKKELENEEK